MKKFLPEYLRISRFLGQILFTPEGKRRARQHHLDEAARLNAESQASGGNDTHEGRRRGMEALVHKIRARDISQQ